LIPSQEHLLIFGASARAAAMSALRAGLRPWCADLFADLDLRRCCSARVLNRRYPDGFVPLAERAPPGPWMYTGGLENRPRLVDKISRYRDLWGNGADILRNVRSPLQILYQLQQRGIPCPQARLSAPQADPDRRWLVKPRCGSGGAGISVWQPGAGRLGRRASFQEYIEGIPHAAVYIGDGRKARLLGVTRQLVGEGWLNAAPFTYCGSIGPVILNPATAGAFQRLGDALVEAFRLRGLFGVDCVLSGETPWPVEVNPRYTASVEILEWSSGLPFVALHGSVFQPSLSGSIPFTPVPGVLGKAVFFARALVVIPEDGPWVEVLDRPFNPFTMPAFADIPARGQRIDRGRPILTFFTQSGSVGDCLGQLQEIAADLDRRLFG
jgi:predicted ATP-grasp superfamily ATP-dependent carboligase